MTNRWGNSERLFWGVSKITEDGDCRHEIKRRLFLERKAMTNLDSTFKSRDITLPTKIHLVKAMVFPVVMWELDYKESWAPKNWCFWAVVLEKTLESPLDCKEIQSVHPKAIRINEFSKAEGKKINIQKSIVFLYTNDETVNPKGNQPWIVNGRTNAEAEAPTFW